MKCPFCGMKLNFPIKECPICYEEINWTFKEAILNILMRFTTSVILGFVGTALVMICK